MNIELQSLHTYGKSLIGKMAQSTVLTMISACGQQAIMQPAQKITAYSVQETFMEPTLMVTIDGTEVFENTLRNIK